MRRLLIVPFVLAVATTAAAFELLRVNDNSCNRGDQNLFWPDAHTQVAINLLPEPQRGLADQARQRWNNSLQRFRFELGNAQPCTRDGVATMSIADTPCGRQGFGDALAITRHVWLRDSGELVDADITFNANSFILDDDAAFRQVAMHELGHVLGLDHSDGCGGDGTGTLMLSRLSGPRLEAPQADDVSGAAAIYPSGGGGGGGGGVPEGANSCAVAPGSPAGAWPLLGAGLLLLARRRWC